MEKNHNVRVIALNLSGDFTLISAWVNTMTALSIRAVENDVGFFWYVFFMVYLYLLEHLSHDNERKHQ